MTSALKPAAEAAKHDRRYPNESPEYRKARTALLAQEIEMRRLIERVAGQRRALPLGGEVPKDYVFEGPDGKVKLSQLFGDQHTLVTYNWMFGPQRKASCPMCANMLNGLDGVMPDILQRAAFVVIATSPIARMQTTAAERGWRHLKLVSSAGNGFNAAYAFEQPGEDNAALNVFVKRDGKVFHFWGDEMGPESMDPGQDPRGASNAMPLWAILDLTPEGRAPDWYPSLDYPGVRRR